MHVAEHEQDAVENQQRGWHCTASRPVLRPGGRSRFSNQCSFTACGAWYLPSIIQAKYSAQRNSKRVVVVTSIDIGRNHDYNSASRLRIRPRIAMIRRVA